MADNDAHVAEGIAIIGMSCRFPGAKDIRTFWHNLRDGVESVSVLPEPGDSDPQKNDSAGGRSVRAAGVVEGIELFDAPFFNLVPAEAALLSPQHRLFLECAWEALEDAGYSPGMTEARIGVYAGTSVCSYLVHNILAGRGRAAAPASFSVSTGNHPDFLALQTSYRLNLKGRA